jgi:hypothetical protein
VITEPTVHPGVNPVGGKIMKDQYMAIPQASHVGFIARRFPELCCGGKRGLCDCDGPRQPNSGNLRKVENLASISLITDCERYRCLRQLSVTSKRLGRNVADRREPPPHSLSALDQRLCCNRHLAVPALTSIGVRPPLRPTSNSPSCSPRYPQSASASARTFHLSHRFCGRSQPR